MEGPVGNSESRTGLTHNPINGVPFANEQSKQRELQTIDIFERLDEQSSFLEFFRVFWSFFRQSRIFASICECTRAWESNVQRKIQNVKSQSTTNLDMEDPRNSIFETGLLASLPCLYMCNSSILMNSLFNSISLVLISFMDTVSMNRCQLCPHCYQNI